MTRTISTFKISHLCAHVCRELHLNEDKYKERISLYIQAGVFTCYSAYLKSLIKYTGIYQDRYRKKFRGFIKKRMEE